MKKTILLSFFLLSIGFKNINAQTNCEVKFGVACYGSSENIFSKVDVPPSFYRGTRGLAINVNYTGFTAPAQAAFDYSKQIWESILNGTQTIKINVYFLALGSGGLLGITFPNGRKNFSGALVSDVWYPTSLANQLAGTELNVGESDFDMYLNSSANWYFGTDGICPTGKYDFASVALHEMCHGFGLVGLSKIDTAGLGSFGLLTLADFAPAFTSFPWPELDTLPGIFDHYLMTSNGALISQGAFQNPSDTLATIFKSNQIYWSGIYGLQFNNNIEPKIYAPPTFSLGSSMVQLDEATYPNGNENELMTPFATAHSSNHNPGPIAIAILKDIGWNVDPNYNDVNNIQNSNSEFQIYPNPVTDEFRVSGSEFRLGNSISISDLAGRILLQQNISEQENKIDVSNFTSGIYFVELKTESGNSILKFVKE